LSENLVGLQLIAAFDIDVASTPALLKIAVRSTKKSLIVDVKWGSMSTRVAAERINRLATGLWRSPNKMRGGWLGTRVLHIRCAWGKMGYRRAI